MGGGGKDSECEEQNAPGDDDEGPVGEVEVGVPPSYSSSSSSHSGHSHEPMEVVKSLIN